MERRFHVLRDNESIGTWRDLIFFDTETQREQVDKDAHREYFKLAVACWIRRDKKREEWGTFHDTNTLTAWILSKTRSRTALRIFAHNLWFDFKVSGLHLELPLNLWKNTRRFFDRNNQGGFLGFRQGSKTMMFIDTQNYFRVGLRELGDSIGLPKLKINFEHCSTEELEQYCRRDVEIIRSAILQFLETLQEGELGTPQRTLAATAFTIFRHRFMKHDVHIHNDHAVLTLEREAYRGGRCDVFQLGKIEGKVYMLDVNSMYPFCMSSAEYPVKLIGHYSRPCPFKAILSFSEDYFFIARVRLNTTRAIYPFKIGKHTAFPVGSFETVLCHHSLVEALERKEVEECLELAIYQKAPLFYNYVQFFWQKRLDAQKEGKQAWNYFYKLVLNALYGKFGQKRSEVVAKYDTDAADFSREAGNYRGQPVEIWNCFGQTTLLATGEKESYHSFPAIAAGVTDLSRVYLGSLIDRAGEENVYYVDTDCLIVNEKGKQRLSYLIGDGLGQLKVKMEANDLEILAPKEYRLGGEWKRKGIRHNAVWNPESKGWWQEEWESFRGSLRTENKDGVGVKMVLKVPNRDLKTRRPGPGGRTQPIVLEAEGKGGEAPTSRTS